jgi:hypothetical protein
MNVQYGLGMNVEMEGELLFCILLSIFFMPSDF